MKKNVEKKVAAPPEKYWQKLVQVYFTFYKKRFKDNDGYMMSPDWSPEKRGMESKGLKEILTRLRTIAEQKDFDWTEEYACEQLDLFLHKAYQKPFIAKSMMCCLMNKYKDEIIVSEYNDPLIKKILECFYFINPQYPVDHEKDNSAAQIIVGFMKGQFLRANIEFKETAVVQSVKKIFDLVAADNFWNQKSLRSISNNLQEFVNIIKSNKDGTGKKGYGKSQSPGNFNSGSLEGPRITTKPKGGFGRL